jgi:hypothetical protein
VWDPGKGADFVLVYRDGSKIAWGKRVHIERFITNKTYPLVKEGSVGIDFLSEKKNPGALQLTMVPVKRQKVRAVVVDLGKIPACGLTARGLKLSQKAVASVQLLPEVPKPEKPVRSGTAAAAGLPAAPVTGKGLLGKASSIAARTPPRAMTQRPPTPRSRSVRKKKR